jgi:selenide, water dikinase
LTKALGTGVISTAIKKGVARQSWIDAAVASMTRLNKQAADIITGHLGTSRPAWTIHAMTDITGFGLIGHAREVAMGSNVSLRVYASRIPLLEGAMDCVRAGHIPGGLKANREFAECTVAYEAGISEEVKTVLFDPQTAGGLFISVAAEDASHLLQALSAAGVPTVEIGEVVSQSKPLMTVVA